MAQKLPSKIILCSNRITKSGDILPIIQNNFLKTRLSDLIELNSNTTKMPLTFNYSPISIGKLRLILHVEHAMRSLKQFGFTKKDVDEVKGIFSEANLYLLCGTMLIASVHVGDLLCNLMNTIISITLRFIRNCSCSSIFYHSKMTFPFGGRKRATLVYRCEQRCGGHSVKLLYFYICWTNTHHFLLPFRLASQQLLR